MTAVQKPVRIRLGSFNFIKGLGIILVVLSHTIGRYSGSPSLIIRFIMTCIMASKALMPMFFIVFGYSFKAAETKKMLKKSFSELLVPYLIVMGAYAVLYPIANYPAYGSWQPAFARSAQFVTAFLLGWTRAGYSFLNYELAWCTAAWFFLTLFVAANVFNLILKLKDQKHVFLAVFFAYSLSFVLVDIGFFLYCIPQALQMVAYCYVGYVLKEYRIIERILNHVWTYVILVSVFFMAYKWGTIDVSQGIFGKYILDFIGMSASGLLLMLLSIHISRFEVRALEWISNIGVYSYWLIIVHAIEMEVIPWYFMPLSMPDHLLIAFFIEILIKIVIMTVTCILMKEIAKRRYRRRRLAAQRSSSRTS